MKVVFIVIAGIMALGAGVFLRFVTSHDEVVSVSPPIVTSVSEPKTYTLLFAGDIMLDREVRTQIVREQDPLYPFARIADTVRSADIAFVNLEGPVSDRGTNQGSKYSFRFEPVGTMSALKFAGFDVVNLANNHIWDWGADALTDTVRYLDEAGVGHIGAGRDNVAADKPFIAQLDEVKIAMLGYTTLYPKSLEAGDDHPGISSFSVSSTIAQIQDLKKQSGVDIAIVSLHWGTEYATSSDMAQKEIARALIDGGADLVIGHHPHVVQEVEKYGSGYIVYSLGNFVFDQFFSKATMSGLMIQANVENKKIKSIEQIPIELTQTFQPYVVGEAGDPTLEVIQ